MNQERDSQPAVPNDAGSGSGELEELREHRRAWEAFAASALRLIPVLKGHMAAVTEETERAVMELMPHLRMLASSERLPRDGDQAERLNKVIMAMQFQDLTRQKLDHVGRVLDQWRLHLRVLLKDHWDGDAKKQILELERIEQVYTMEEERRLHAAVLMEDCQEPVATDQRRSEQASDSVTLF